MSRGLPIGTRLLLALLIALPLCLIASAVVIDRAYRDSLISAERQELQTQFYGLLGALEWQDGELNISERLKEPRFSQIQSGLYAQVIDPAGTLLWRSHSASGLGLDKASVDAELRKPGSEHFDLWSHKGQSYFRYRYHLIWETPSGRDQAMIIELLSDQSGFKKERLSFQQTLLVGLLSVAVLLIFLQWCLIRWSLAPLRLMGQEIQQMSEGQRPALSDDYPKELSKITLLLNRVLQREKKQRERYRNTLGDLAHSLKTPITVLDNLDQNRQLPDEAGEQVQSMKRIVQYQLKRAVNAGPQAASQGTDCLSTLQRIERSLRRVYPDKALTLHSPNYSVLLPCDESDAMELLGNLLDNAWKAADSAIRVQASRGKASVTLIIEDDGPGMSASQLEQLRQRGRRGDQYGSGQGLGLSIVDDLISSLSGELQFDASPSIGGLRVCVVLPLDGD